MEIVGLESLDEETVAIYQKSELIGELESIRTRVATEGMTRDDAVLLERIAPGIFDGMNVNKFTVRPSVTGQTVAVEAIDWKRGALVVGAAMAIIAVISKIISWLSDSLTTTGGGSGGIKDIDETNSKIEKRCQDNVETEVITEENLQKVGKEVVRKIGKLSNVNMHYVNELVEKVDKGDVVNSNGKPIAPNDVSNAVNKYVDAVKRTRATDRDTQLHALLGYMLLSKQGGIPMTLLMLDWKGGVKGSKLDQTHIMALEHTIELTNEVLDEVGKLASAIESTDYKSLVMLEDDKHVDGSTGGGSKIYGLMSKSNDVLKRVRNTLETNNSLRNTYSPNMATELNGNRPDTATMGRILPEFNTDVKKVISEMKDLANTYITFWDMSDYQNYVNKVDAAKYTDLIIALADPKGREELAKLYRMVFDTSSNSSKPKSEGSLKVSADKLKTASTAVNKIHKKATKLDSAWIGLPFAVAANGGFKPDNTISYTPMTQLKVLVDTASALSRRATELASVINLGLRDADRAINMTAKMK
ncbi:hypothetical protein pVa21_235 [Vibrio phage pVa-21]|nr:hypothetical protein pVa21_235 [Vibrio phage pVa-21]